MYAGAEGYFEENGIERISVSADGVRRKKWSLHFWPNLSKTPCDAPAFPDSAEAKKPVTTKKESPPIAIESPMSPY